jgi:hypothetical protein
LPFVPLDYAIQGFATWILKNEDSSPVMTSQRERLSGPCRIEFGRERIFVFEASETLRRRLFRGNRHRQYRHLVGALFAMVEREIRSLANRFQDVLGMLDH